MIWLTLLYVVFPALLLFWFILIAWAILGASFGPPVLLSIWWERPHCPTPVSGWGGRSNRLRRTGAVRWIGTGRKALSTRGELVKVKNSVRSVIKGKGVVVSFILLSYG